MKFTRVAAARRANGVELNAPGSHPGNCIANCMSNNYKLSALNKEYCFCVKGGLALEDSLPEGDDVLTVLDATIYMPKADGKSTMADG